MFGPSEKHRACCNRGGAGAADTAHSPGVRSGSGSGSAHDAAARERAPARTPTRTTKAARDAMVAASRAVESARAVGRMPAAGRVRTRNHADEGERSQAARGLGWSHAARGGASQRMYVRVDATCCTGAGVLGTPSSTGTRALAACSRHVCMCVQPTPGRPRAGGGLATTSHRNIPKSNSKHRQASMHMHMQLEAAFAVLTTAQTRKLQHPARTPRVGTRYCRRVGA
jgi:hypothetical protein